MSELRPAGHFLGPIGKFFGARPDHFRGDAVMTPDGPRVVKYGVNPDGTPGAPIGLGYLSPTADAVLNPAGLETRHAGAKVDRREAELARRFDEKQRRDWQQQGFQNDVQLGQLANQTEQIRQQSQQILAGIADSQAERRLRAGMHEDNVGLQIAALDRSAATQLLGMQMQDRQFNENLTLSREQLAAQQASVKRDAISRMAAALLTG